MEALMATFAIMLAVVCFYVWRCYVTCRSVMEEEEVAAELQPAGVTPLDGGVVASFPVFVHRSSDDEEMKQQLDPCAVCLQEFVDGEVVRLLSPCSHRYHAKCIDRWFSTHSTCPLCRRLLGSLDV